MKEPRNIYRLVNVKPQSAMSITEEIERQGRQVLAMMRILAGKCPDCGNKREDDHDMDPRCKQCRHA